MPRQYKAVFLQKTLSQDLQGKLCLIDGKLVLGWLVNASFSENDLLQMPQEYGASFEWISLSWTFNWALYLKSWSKVNTLKRIPSWRWLRFLWVPTSIALWKVLLHCWHLNFLSLVCTYMWRCNISAFVNCLSQIWHAKSVSPVSRKIWSERFPLFTNCL